MNSVLSLLVAGAAAAQLGSAAVIPQQLESRATVSLTLGSTTGAYTSVGCYGNPTGLFAPGLLEKTANILGGVNLDTCATAAAGFKYFAVTNGAICTYGNTISTANGAGKVATDFCALPCVGNLAQNCGSLGFSSVYQTTASLPPVTTTAVAVTVPVTVTVPTTTPVVVVPTTTPVVVVPTTTPVVVVPTTTPVVVVPTTTPVVVVPTTPVPQVQLPWVAASVACTAEVEGRALTGDSLRADDMTPAKCTSYCGSKGFAIAGVEYAVECFCGNSLSNGASLTKTSGQCNMACGGDANQNCGGPNALRLYVTPSAITNLNADLTTKVVAPIVPALASGFSAATSSCIAEGSGGRALTGAQLTGPDMTPLKCTTYCSNQGFKYAGVEYGSECFCGNDFSNGASLAKTSNACNMPCSGNSANICGGPNALNLYVNPTIAPVVINGYTALGCVQEVAGRALTGLRKDDPNMTQATCIATCTAAGFKYAGVEYGVECYCGNEFSNGASISNQSGQCYMDCPGNKGQKCGGPNAIQLFGPK